MNSLLTAVLAGLTGMLGWGLADFFAKKTIDKVGDMATLAWAHIYGVITILSILLGRLLSNNAVLQFPTSLKEVVSLAFFGALQAAVYAFVYKAFAKGKLSLLNPVFSSYSGLVVLMSVLIFGELIGGLQILVLLLVFVGIMIINIDQESLALRKFKFLKIPGMKEILTAAAMASIWTVLWGHFVTNKDWLVYASIMYVFMTLSILFISVIQKIKLNVLDSYTWKYFLLIGISEVGAYIGISLGYSATGHISIVAVLSAAFSVPTLILANIFLKERITKLQLLGVAVVISGVVLISLV